MSEMPTPVDLIDPEVWQDLHTPLGGLRERTALSLDPQGAGWMVLRYAEVESVLRDPRIASLGVELLEAQGIDEGPLHRWWQRIPIGVNPPIHTRLRSLVGRAFTPRRAERARPLTRAVANELLDRVESKGEMEVVADFAHHLPIRIVSKMLAIPDGDYERFAHWTGDLGLAFSPFITPEVRAITEDAVSGLYLYVAELVERRRADPGPDLLSALIAAEQQGDRLSHEELLAMVVSLLFAGHDTTMSLLSLGVKTFLEHPKALERVRRRPALMRPAIDEILRFESPIFALAREVREPMRLGSVELAPGDRLILNLLAANRDPRQFADPDRFDPEREDNRHLSFGLGQHYCLGSALARAEVEEALNVLFARCPDLRIVGGPPRWVPYTVIRRLETLHVAF